KLAHNELKPQLDLKGNIGAAGLGGTQLLFGGTDPFNPVVIGTLPGGYTDALGNLFHNPTYSVGLVFSLPIGNESARADYARASLQEKQANTQLDTTRQDVIVNVKTALRNLQSDLKVLDAA